MALGLTTPDGRDPALYASIDAPPSIRANASAIWLRLEFSTQTNSTRFTLLMWTPEAEKNSNPPHARIGKREPPMRRRSEGR